MPLTVAAESTASYDRSPWESGGYRAATDTALGWNTSSCKWAFYASGSKDCTNNASRDHLVAVKEAHDSGGHAWTNTEKRNFYNDVDNLFVMSTTENSSKGSKDPADWKPSDSNDYCRYAEIWVNIKDEYDLTIDSAEKAALETMLASCPHGGVVSGWCKETTESTDVYTCKYEVATTDAGGLFKAKVSAFKDTAGNSGTAQSYNATGVTADGTAPTVSSVSASGTTLTVTMSEKVYAATAPDNGDFVITGGGAPTVSNITGLATAAGSAANSFSLTLSAAPTGGRHWRTRRTRRRQSGLRTRSAIRSRR